MKTSIALLVSGLAAQQVSATWNLNAKNFNTPKYNNNECTDKQKGGFSWGDLPTGNFNNYGDFNFKGGSGSWSCANSFGKRDLLHKRTFNSKCIKNKVKKDKPAQFDCGDKKKEGFSVKEIEVSVEFDCDLEFHYKMPDNSICKQVKRCSKDGTLVKNTQCGGATSVDVYLGQHNQKSREDCEIGFHRIDFDCNSGYTPTPKPSTPASSKPVSSKPATQPTPPASSKPVSSYPASQPPSPPSSKPASSQPASSSYPASQPPASSKPASSSQPGPSQPASSYPASQPPASSKPASSAPATYPASQPPQTSSKPVETPASSKPLPSAPASMPYGNSTIAYPPPATSSRPASSSAPVASSVSSKGPVPSSPPGGYTPPSCLPKCMNTWLQLESDCQDNTDSNCYCKNPKFTKEVIECVAAWAKDDKEIQESLQYLIGICAPFVPQNPGLITDCPTYIPINPTKPIASSAPTGAPSGPAPPVTTAAPSAPPQGPVTQITYQTTVTQPCGCGVPGSSTVNTISTVITVPQVVFTTNTPAQPPAPGVTPTEQPIVLIPGTPTAVPAITTGGAPYPIPSNGLPSNFGTVTIPGRNGTATATRPAQFTGAASSVAIGFQPALFGAILALFAL